MEFDSMIFYRSWMEAVAELDPVTQGEVYRAIVIYGMNNEIPEGLSPVAKAMFIMAKPNIDANNAKRRKNAENGAKGGRPKANEKPKETQTKPKQNPNETESKPTQKPNGLMVNGLMVNENVIKTIPPKAADDERFETFWKTYPKKVGKKDAQRAWKKIKPDKDLFDRIIKAVTDWKDSDQWTKDGGQYIPNPATWLNRGSWDDEIPKVRAPAKKNSFNNFPQRARTQNDYDEIERNLLGVRRHA